MKALALFSGGLDSGLAIKIIQNQGIEVIALNFVSYFFGGSSEKIEKMAEQLGVKVEYIDVKKSHREVVKNPASGYGKQMNPCIDCHALMIKTAGDLLQKYGASFIITGEVVGQRPMSQNTMALKRVEKLSGYKGLIVRPLSGKILERTIPEENGWIKREELLDINGRGRKQQIELAEKYGIKEYPSPAGGCLLTEKNYSDRLITLKEDERFEIEDMFEIIKYGRFFRLEKGKYIVVARKEEEGITLEKFKNQADLYIEPAEIPGPIIIGKGEFEELDVEFIKKLFSRYSKIKGNEKISMKINGNIVEEEKIEMDEFEREMKKYQVV